MFSLVGIVIALSLVSGSWIAVDSSGIGLLRAAVDGVPVDFVGYQLPNAFVGSNDLVNVTESTVSIIEAVDDVRTVAPSVSVKGAWFMNSSGGVYLNESGQEFNGTLVFLSSGSHRLLDSFRIEGSMPEPGTVTIPKDIADSLHLGIGDEVTSVFMYQYYYRIKGNDTWLLNTTYLNITSSVSDIWTQPDYEVLNQNGFAAQVEGETGNDVWLGVAANPVVFDISDYEKTGIDRSTLSPLYTVSLNYFIWTDRSAVITLADIPESVDRLGYIENRLANRLYSLGMTVTGSYLVAPLESLKSDIGGEEPLYLALSAPVLALGIYLSMVGVDLGLNERRREAGILKSRGASDRQVFGSLIVEALSLGAVSGLVGLLLGALVSRFLLAPMATLGGEAMTELTDFVASPATIMVSIVLGIGLMLISTYGPFKRVSESDVAPTLHHYSPTAARLDYWAGADVILLAMSLWSVVATMLGSDWPSHQGFSWVVEIVVRTVVLFGVSILPLLPFMLSLSLVRLVTRGSRRVYSKFTWFVKPWTKDLHFLVVRNIVRNPRRASNLCVIIALALAFGLFISVTMESTLAYKRELVRFEVGSDIRLDVSVPDSHDQFINVSILEETAEVPGVERSVTFSQTDLLFDIAHNYHHVQSAVMNMTDYRETVNPSDFYFIGDKTELLDESSGEGAVLVTEEFAVQTDLRVGDSFPVIMSSYSEYNLLRVNVVGMVKGLPGFPDVDAFMDRKTLSAIPDENLTGVFTSNGVLIKAAEGSDLRAISDDSVELLENANLSCTPSLLTDRLGALKTEASYASLAGFLYMEYALSIVIMTIGVGLLIFVAVNDRQNELACIMARGSSGGQLRRVLMGESLSLMILGLVVGVCVGIATAYLFNVLSAEALYAAVERRMTVTYVSFSIVISSIVALLVASLLATSRAGKIKLAEALRIRGG